MQQVRGMLLSLAPHPLTKWMDENETKSRAGLIHEREDGSTQNYSWMGGGASQAKCHIPEGGAHSLEVSSAQDSGRVL